jgi:hypothetical protein
MPHQTRSTTIATPLFSPDSVTDLTTTYSSFEKSQPGFRFLSNDPLSKDTQPPQSSHHHHQEFDNEAPAPPTDADAIKSRYPGSDDSAFVDLLYIVDSAGKTSVTNITTPDTAALAVEAHQHHVAVAPSCPPPHIGAFELPSPTPTPTTTTATSTALPGSETSDDDDANELDYYTKLMVWWPTADADELKVERM